MTDRKYVTELALGFFSKGVVLLHPKDIRTIDQQSPQATELAEDCHIYLIVKRPRLSYLPNSLVIGDEKTVGRFKYAKNGVVKEAEFSLQGKPDADSVEISSYPHTKLSLVRGGETVFTIPAHLMSMMCDYISEPEVRDLEVVYVGMSYADGKRSAKDRLLSHSTLQQVLADLNQDFPDMEVLIIMVQYEPPQVLISIDGRDKSLDPNRDRDVVSDLKRQQTMVTKDLQIALIEAALIKYFEPCYNDKYKKRFPQPTQKILQEVYDIDFGALITEINTEVIKGRLFSKVRSAGYHHIASYDLHDPSERRSFFNAMNVEHGSNADNHSGPIY